MEKQKFQFLCMLLVLLLFAGCTGETLPTATPSETSPLVSYKLGIGLRDADILPDALFLKGISEVAKTHRRIELTVNYEEGGSELDFLSIFSPENLDGALILSQDFRRHVPFLKTITPEDTSWHILCSAIMDNSIMAEQAVNLASGNIEGNGFYFLVDNNPPSFNSDPGSLRFYDNFGIHGLIPAWGDGEDVFYLSQNTQEQYSAFLQDITSNLAGEDVVIFVRSEQLLLKTVETTKGIQLKYNMFIIGYGVDYILTEKTYQAMQEHPNIFFGVICPNFYQMGKMAAEGLVAYLDGSSLEEVTPYFEAPFFTITNKTLDNPDVQVFLREMDVLPIRR